jgi:hypothetical protein
MTQSLAKPNTTHTDVVFEMSVDQAVAFAIERALANGCTCHFWINITDTGFELLHDGTCPRLRTIGSRQ